MSTGDAVLLIIVVVALVIGLGSMAVGWITGDRVNDIDDAAPVVMSRSEESAPSSSPSSLQTDETQTADRPMIPKPTPDKMLDIFKVLRAAGVDREELRGPWRAAGLPLDNNVWAKAKPTALVTEDEDDVLITPWAGRRTSKKFYPDDPDLEYKAPAT